MTTPQQPESIAVRFLRDYLSLARAQKDITRFEKQGNFADLGSAGLELASVAEYHEASWHEAQRLTRALQQMRTEYGDEKLIAHLVALDQEGCEGAIRYLHGLADLEQVLPRPRRPRTRERWSLRYLFFRFVWPF